MNPTPPVLRHALATVPYRGVVGCGVGLGAWTAEASTRKRKPKVSPARLVGLELLAKFRQDLARLSPKLSAIARYCLQHHASLHLQRITHVAQHSDTQPSTVVRFAKQYGYSGFNDFKFAFLAPTPEPIVPTPPALVEPLPKAGLEPVVNLLRQAPHIWMVGPGSSVPLASALLEGWRRQGRQVTWVVCEPDALPEGALEGAARGDAVLWLDMDPQGGEPLRLEEQVRGRVGVVSVGMKPQGGADASLILPATGGDRRWWMTTWAHVLLAGMC